MTDDLSEGKRKAYEEHAKRKASAPTTIKGFIHPSAHAATGGIVRKALTSVDDSHPLADLCDRLAGDGFRLSTGMPALTPARTRDSVMIEVLVDAGGTMHRETVEVSGTVLGSAYGRWYITDTIQKALSRVVRGVMHSAIQGVGVATATSAHIRSTDGEVYDIGGWMRDALMRAKDAATHAASDEDTIMGTDTGRAPWRAHLATISGIRHDRPMMVSRHMAEAINRWASDYPMFTTGTWKEVTT